MRISVLIADGHPVYRSGLAGIVRERPEFEIVGEAGDGAAALDGIRRLAPDVAVVDLQLPHMTGNEVAEAIALEGLATRVVIVSAGEDAAAIERAFAAGVRAYLPKIVAAETLCDTLLAVARGRLVRPQPAAQGATRATLTSRETEILRLMADGRSAPEIAEALAVSAATVRSHLQHVYEKLGVSDRAAAVAQGFRRGLLD
jgi:two-component system nitrate/nitrite response regulator NarL